MTATLPNPQTAEDIAPSAITANDIFETYKHRQITLTILGSGAWGSALAHIANSNHHNVRIWSRRGIYPYRKPLKEPRSSSPPSP